MSNREKRSETIAILLDQAFVSGGNFLTSLVLARTLVPTEYGKFSLVLLFLYAINTCHSSVVVYPLILRAASGSQKELPNVTASSLVQTVLLCLPLGVVCVAFSVLAGDWRIAFPLILAMCAWQMQETTRRALLASHRAAQAVLPDLVCFVGQGLILFLLKAQGLTEILSVIVGTSLLALVWQAALLRITRASVTRSMMLQDARAAWEQGRHILGGNAFNMVALQLPSWTLAFFGGPVAVAGYQALLNLAGIANPIIFSVNTALIPAVARSAEDGYLAARKTALRVGLQYGALLLPCFLALGLAPAFVMRRLYGAGTPYLHLAGLLPVFIVAYAIQYVATVIGAYEGGMARPQTYFRVQAISTIALALLAVPLVRYQGVKGAVIAILAFSIFRMVSFALFSIQLDHRKEMKPVEESLLIDEQQTLRVAVCLLTYRRPDMLRQTLGSIRMQSVCSSGRCDVQVIVVDNDADETARTTVEEVAAGQNFSVCYIPNPSNGLSTGRNVALNAAAGADYLVFIDDDEVASTTWLEHLLYTALHTKASVVTGPVDPILDGAPDWIRRGKFFAPPSYASGSQVLHAATNNTLIHSEIIANFRFDRQFDRTGGEDTDFFLRVRKAGYPIVWCNEARVQEWVPGSRANQEWIVARAQSDANRFTLGYLRLHGGVRSKSIRLIKAFAGAGVGLATAPLSVLGQHYGVRSRTRIARAKGTLSALRGISRDDYAGDAEGDRSTRREKLSVVVVGQTPPPLNGQTIMIREFVQGTYGTIDIKYVPMRFSRSANEVGRLDWRKPFLLFSTVASIIKARWQSGPAVLYYPPAGANLVPVVRDIFILSLCRRLFRKTAFHFHAAGLSRIYPVLPRVLRPLFALAYNNPDLAIFTTEATSSEALFLRARRTAIVPCGAPDPYTLAAPSTSARTGSTILFAGILCEGKGVMTLLHACALLNNEDLPFNVKLMGAFQSNAFEDEVRRYIADNSLEDNVSFLGVLSGADKDAAFAGADVFCFPSHYPAESFGVVLIEAMSHALPIIATDWQGIPEVTGRDELGSLLVPVRDPEALADAMAEVLNAHGRREAMGAYNRSRYLEQFTLEKYRAKLEECLTAL